MLRSVRMKRAMLPCEGSCVYGNARRYLMGASTDRSVVMMAKMPLASRMGTERVIIHISPPPVSK